MTGNYIYYPPFPPEEPKTDPMGHPVLPDEPTIGHNCSRCNERNDYAESNQPDGSYLCYRCR